MCTKEGRTSSPQGHIWQKGHGGEQIKVLNQIAESRASQYCHGFEQSHWTECKGQAHQMNEPLKYIHVVQQLEHDLVELGFATCNATTGKIHIPDEQLAFICYFNETCLLLNGIITNWGGRTEALIYDPRFPLVVCVFGFR